MCVTYMEIQRLTILKICEPNNFHLTVNLGQVAVGLKTLCQEFLGKGLNIRSVCFLTKKMNLLGDSQAGCL